MPSFPNLQHRQVSAVSLYEILWREPATCVPKHPAIEVCTPWITQRTNFSAMSTSTLSFIHVDKTHYRTDSILRTGFSSPTHSGSAAILIGGSESIQRRTASWRIANTSYPSYSAPHCSQSRAASPPSRYHNGQRLEIRRIAVFEKQMHCLERAPANPCYNPFLKSIRRIGYSMIKQ